MAKTQVAGRDVTVIRDAQSADAGYDANKVQKLVRDAGGVEKLVESKDIKTVP